MDDKPSNSLDFIKWENIIDQSSYAICVFSSQS